MSVLKYRNPETGEWEAVIGGGGENNVFIAEYGVTTCAEIEAEYQAGKTIVAIMRSPKYNFIFNDVFRQNPTTWYFSCTRQYENSAVKGKWARCANNARCINDEWALNAETWLWEPYGIQAGLTPMFQLSPSDDGIACNINGAEGYLATLEDIEAITPIISKNITVSNWTANTTYADYGYRASVAITGVTTNHIPNVTFGVTEALSGNYAPVAESYVGGVYLYSKVNTAITIPSIVCIKEA